MENSQSNFVKIIREICEEEQIRYWSYSSNWAFQLERQGKCGFILGYQFGLNVSVSQQISADKSVASEVLSQHKVPNVEHRCFMAPHMFCFTGGNGNWKEIIKLLEEHRELVCKDNQGTGGHLVYRVKSQRQLEEAADEIFSKTDAMAVSPYYEIQQEYRVVMLDEEVQIIFSKERRQFIGDGHSTLRQLYGTYLLKEENAWEILDSSADFNRVLKKGEVYFFHWKHNLGQGASAKIVTDQELREQLGELARQAVRVLQLRFASVDLINCPEGLKVLEVNSGVMMENLAGTGANYYQKVKEIYRKAIEKMLQ